MTDAEKIKNEFDLSLLAKNTKGIQSLNRELAEYKEGYELLKSAFESFKSGLFSSVYPVGCIYMSTSSTSPATLFGGTWSRIQGKFLLAANDSTTAYNAGKTGGAVTHTHTTSGHTLTVSEIPAHKHTTTVKLKMASGYNVGELNTQQLAIGMEDSGGTNENIYTNANPVVVTNGSIGGGSSHSHGNTGSGSTMPPFLAVYVWKRTA